MVLTSSAGIQDDPIEISYQLKNGETGHFRIDKGSTEAFGFCYQDRVNTPRGPADVIGVKDGNLWFHVHSDSGASYWSGCKTSSDFLTRNFVIAEGSSAKPNVDPNEYHRIKNVVVSGQTRRIVIQNVNGPCPIIALANALLLSGKMTLPAEYEGKGWIKSEALKYAMLRYLSDIHPLPSFQSPPKWKEKELLAGRVQDQAELLRSSFIAEPQIGLQLLTRLYEGLNITPVFSHIDAFEAENDCCIFSLGGIRVLHGWLADPDNEDENGLVELSYLDAAALSTDDTNRLGTLAREFLDRSKSQLTERGLLMLQRSLEDGDVAVVFRDNHFATLVKSNEKVYFLVSDEGYADRKMIVFEELTLQGGGPFADGNFEPLAAHFLGILSAYGDSYTEEEMKSAETALQSSGTAVTVQGMVSWIDEKRKSSQAANSNSSLPTSTAAPPPLCIDSHEQRGPNVTPEAAPLASPVAAHYNLDSATVQQTKVVQLTSMGFSEEVARNALEVSQGSVERAIELLFNETADR